MDSETATSGAKYDTFDSPDCILYCQNRLHNFSLLYFLQATLESKTHEAEAKINIEKQGRMKAASVNDKLHAEKSELEEALSKGQTLITDMEAKVKNIEAEKKEVDRQVRKVHIF